MGLLDLVGFEQHLQLLVLLGQARLPRVQLGLVQEVPLGQAPVAGERHFFVKLDILCLQGTQDGENPSVLVPGPVPGPASEGPTPAGPSAF